MIGGISINELLFLAALIIAGGIVTGLLAGLFGIGGGGISCRCCARSSGRSACRGGPSACVGLDRDHRSATCGLSGAPALRRGFDGRGRWSIPSSWRRRDRDRGAASAGFTVAFIVVTFIIGQAPDRSRRPEDPRNCRAAQDGRLRFRVGLAAPQWVSAAARLNMIPHPARAPDPQRVGDLRRSRRADHHCRRHRLRARRLTAAVLMPPLSVGFVSLWLCPDGAGRLLWRPTARFAMRCQAGSKSRSRCSCWQFRCGSSLSLVGKVGTESRNARHSAGKLMLLAAAVWPAAWS
jgi:hypothetical protein